jgi:hypothetical protein
MINITLHNADAVDIFVSAVDNNQPGMPVVFPNQRLNEGSTSAQFSVQEVAAEISRSRQRQSISMTRQAPIRNNMLEVRAIQWTCGVRKKPAVF